jgi:hypothetical protein
MVVANMTGKPTAVPATAASRSGRVRVSTLNSLDDAPYEPDRGLFPDEALLVLLK